METEKTLVSIIVPVYNREDYIRDCLSSIGNQTRREIEVIIIDDGSTDCSCETIEEYTKTDHRFRLIRKQHEGVSAARNAGIDVANGEFLTFIDSDDFVEPDYIANLVSSIDDADLCLAGYKRWDVENDRWEIRSLPSETVLLSDIEDTIQQYMTILQGIGWRLYRRKIIEEHIIRFSENIEYGEDTLFLFNYLEFCRYLTVSDFTGYVYRKIDKKSLNKRAMRQTASRMAFLTELEEIYGTSEKLRYIVAYCQLLHMWYSTIGLRYQIREYRDRRNRFCEVASRYHLKEKSRIIRPGSKGMLLLKISLLTNTFFPLDLMIKHAGRIKRWDRIYAEETGDQCL